MTRISKEDFYNDKTNCVVVIYYVSESMIVFYVDHSRGAEIIRKYQIKANIYSKRNTHTYFRLTDEEVRDMVLPRII